MKIGIFGDLHLEHDNNWNYEEQEDVLYLCSGDIGGALTRQKFLNAHPDLFYVYGNHDYYSNAYAQGVDWKDSKEHKKELLHKGMKIRGATLWTKMNDNCDWLQYKGNIYDVTMIQKMTYESYQETHEVHKDWLFNSDADILVMHHSPSYRSTAARFIGDPDNKYFATELSHLILDMKRPPKLIIHGHMHNPVDYMIGDTRVINHPRGYPNENTYFKTYKPMIIEV